METIETQPVPTEIKRFAFIDMPNLDRTTKTILDFSIDWSLLAMYLNGPRWNCEKVFIYSGVPEYRSERQIKAWQSMGYEVRAKISRAQKDSVRQHPYTCATCGNENVLEILYPGAIKSNCDVDLTLDVMKVIGEATEILIFSGDGDFCPLIEYAMDISVQVRVISSMKRDRNGNKRFSSALQDLIRAEEITHRTRTTFIDINDWRNTIAKKPPTSVTAFECTS